MPCLPSRVNVSAASWNADGRAGRLPRAAVSGAHACHILCAELPFWGLSSVSAHKIPCTTLRRHTMMVAAAADHRCRRVQY